MNRNHQIADKQRDKERPQNTLELLIMKYESTHTSRLIREDLQHVAIDDDRGDRRLRRIGTRVALRGGWSVHENSDPAKTAFE